MTPLPFELEERQVDFAELEEIIRDEEAELDRLSEAVRDASHPQSPNSL